MNSRTVLNRLADERFDLLVIGGGITGAGVALDGASRGLRTALVEKADFASGTSSRSSKLVHGGLRYLRQGDLGLVLESLQERQRLLENAPHLVTPLPFLIPLFGSRWPYVAALWTYDLSGSRHLGRHRAISRAEVLSWFPALESTRLTGGYLYPDAWADDSRLTLAVVRTAVADFDVVAANYLGADAYLYDHAGRVFGAKVRPAEHRDGADTFDIRARVVVNATGVWADEARTLDDGTRPPRLRPAKGVHVTVRAQRFPAEVAAVLPVRQDRRSVFVIPWPESDRVYIGTTDTDYEGSLDQPLPDPDDVEYLLSAVNAVSATRLHREDITGIWAGLRPLLAGSPGKRARARTADLSRRHRVEVSDNGVVTVTGGKLTTYRRMAEDTVDAVMDLLDCRPRPPCRTTHLRLMGADPRPWVRADEEATPEPSSAITAQADVLAHLRRRYGEEASAVLAVARERADLLAPLVDGLGYLRAEAVYAARHEMARTVGDILYRRTQAAWQDLRSSALAAQRTAELIAPELGWSPRQAAAEASRFVEDCTALLTAAGLPGAEATGPQQRLEAPGR